MSDISNAKGFSTKAIHAGHDPFDFFGAVNPPVFLTSTYAQKAPGEHQGYEYSRSGSPTRAALEAQIAAIEGGSRGTTGPPETAKGRTVIPAKAGIQGDPTGSPLSRG